jgi:hypothetical protein
MGSNNLPRRRIMLSSRSQGAHGATDLPAMNAADGAMVGRRGQPVVNGV